MTNKAKATLTSVLIGLATVSLHAIEVTPNNMVSPSTCNQYIDVTRKNICLEIEDIEQEIESYPIRMHEAKLKLKSAQDLKKKLILAGEKHLNVFNLSTTHAHPTVSKYLEKYKKLGFGQQLLQDKEKIDATIQSATKEMHEAEQLEKEIPTLKLISDGYKVQLKIYEFIEEK